MPEIVPAALILVFLFLVLVRVGQAIGIMRHILENQSDIIDGDREDRKLLEKIAKDLGNG